MCSRMASAIKALRPALYTLALVVLSASACQRLNPDERPQLVPLHLRFENVFELDNNYPPSDLFGRSYVSTGTTGEIYIVNIETGQTRRLTGDGRPKHAPALSEGYVAWIEYDNPSKFSDGRASNDIFVLDMETGEQRRITDAPAERTGLSVHGHRLVWSERRYQGTGSDIYAYDLESGEEIPVSVGPGSQREPAIHGNMVVWADNRDSPHLGTVKAGCGNCAENTFDIYLYDFETGETRPIVQTGALNASPSVYGGKVVWLRYRTDPDSASVYLLDLETGLERRIADPGIHGGRPLISGRHVAWSMEWPCDVSSNNQPKITGLYLSDIAKRETETTQLSGYIEPRSLIHDNVLVIIEGID